MRFVGSSTQIWQQLYWLDNSNIVKMYELVFEHWTLNHVLIMIQYHVLLASELVLHNASATAIFTGAIKNIDWNISLRLVAVNML